ISGVPFCEGIEFMPDGNMLIGVGATSSVRKYTPAGNLVSTIVQPGTLNLLTPNAVVKRRVQTTTRITEPSRFKDLTLVNPSVGNSFNFIKSELIPPDAHARVTNMTGAMVKNIPLADSTA